MAIQLDTLANGRLTARSEGGRIVEARRTGQITGLAGTTADAWMTEAAAQLPPTGSTITIAGTELRLLSHNLSVVERATCDVELIYEYVPNNLFGGGSNWRSNVRMAGTTQQAISRIIPNTSPPQDIELTFKGVTQGGEYSFLEPNATLEVTLYEALADPWALPQEWMGKLNATPWAGGAAKTWLCTNVSVLPVSVNVDPPEFEVTYQFQWRPLVGEPPFDTAWQPQVVYTDPETGKPPKGWKAEGTAWQTIEHYETKEFGEKFA